jgi:hypothetical protein
MSFNRQLGGMRMQILRKLALAICLSIFAFAMPNLAQAAPLAGISQAAPAVAASETSQNALPMVQKAWWHRWGWHHWGWHRWHYWHPCWHCWHHWGWHRWHYWHRW